MFISITKLFQKVAKLINLNYIIEIFSFRAEKKLVSMTSKYSIQTVKLLPDYISYTAINKLVIDDFNYSIVISQF